jgi:hypothetical protein
MRAAFLVALASVMVAAAGCLIITGSTDGYTAAQSGQVTCTSAAQCDGGAVCCLSVSNSTTSVVGACQSTCTTSLPQLCTTNAECGDAGPCAMLSCTVDGSPVAVTIQACGTVQGCKAQ